MNDGSSALNARLGEITQRIVVRSRETRDRYLDRIAKAAEAGPRRARLGCANQAHGFAACGVSDKSMLRSGTGANLAIVTAYNDMLSAHQPYEGYPEMIRRAAREAGGVAQVAGGVPAMCDGVTQGEAGMELSLVLARGDRALDRRRAVAPDLRHLGLSRHLRQDRAGPRHRGAELRPSAGDLHPGRAHDVGPAQRPEGQDPPALRRGQGRPRGAARSRRPNPTTAPAPARSTAPPTPTR